MAIGQAYRQYCNLSIETCIVMLDGIPGACPALNYIQVLFICLLDPCFLLCVVEFTIIRFVHCIVIERVEEKMVFGT